MGKVYIQNEVYRVEFPASLTVDERAFPSYICAGSGVVVSSPSERLSHIHLDCLSVLELYILYY